MKTLWEIMAWVEDKDRFIEIDDYISFAKTYLEFIQTKLQAEIVAQNEVNYRFFQYKRDGEYNITRPVNGNLFFNLEDYEEVASNFIYTLEHIVDIAGDMNQRENVNSFIYTTQQAIGCALDALPASENNKARKINGDLFERLMLIVLKQTGISADSETIMLPTNQGNDPMKFQNDLEIKVNGEIVAIGSVKTTSKDRLSKMFLDKMMYNKLTNSDTSHFAIFLHDVQRTGSEPNYKVGQTFKTGHFKAYTITLAPLDGIYYCDLRPIMRTDPLLQEQIKSLDYLLCEDMWDFVN